MNSRKFYLGVLLSSLLGAIIALGAYNLLVDKDADKNYESISERQNVRFSSMYGMDSADVDVPAGLDFVFAANQSTPGVVHIRSFYDGSAGGFAQSPMERLWRDFFGDEMPPQAPQRDGQRPQGTGSGVIISDNGYIATNNHVVENAEEIKVTLFDNREYDAKLVGTDPTTDLALIKVDEENLPFIKYGKSDEIQVGQWVLAVGNPFNLTSTVTAGIVSAKGRNINILRDQSGLQIESFIQTDAAVNPGNSGGALVDLNGRLVGINTAIATPTGSYAGYSFAVPVDLVAKVMDDLKEYGMVQRALLGVQIMELNDPRLKDKEFDVTQGVYINSVTEESAAEEAGLEEGDIVISVNGSETNSVSELQEVIARKHPGDAVEVTYLRDGKERTTNATLKNTLGNTEVVKKESTLSVEGAVFENLTDELKDKFEVDYGVHVVEVNGGRFKTQGLPSDVVITAINKKAVEDLDDLMRIIREEKDQGILIKYVKPNGETDYLGMGW